MRLPAAEAAPSRPCSEYPTSGVLPTPSTVDVSGRTVRLMYRWNARFLYTFPVWDRVLCCAAGSSDDMGSIDSAPFMLGCVSLSVAV